MDESTRPLLMTVKEVSTLLRIHRPKVYDLIKEGTLKGFKLGSDWRVRRESLELLIGAIPDEFFAVSSETASSEISNLNSRAEIKLAS